MTVRELIQTLLLQSPSLDAQVYISKDINDFEVDFYKIVDISPDVGDDIVDITIKDWEA